MLRRWLNVIGFLILGCWVGLLGYIFSIISLDAVSSDNGKILALVFIVIFVIGMPLSIFAVAKLLMRMFDNMYAVSGEQRRYLAFGSVLFRMNGESCRILKLRTITKGKAKLLFGADWGIRGHDEAQHTADYLAAAEGHTPFADKVYKTLIKNGRLEPLTLEELQYIAGSESSKEYLARINRGLKSYKSARKMFIKLGYTESELSEIESVAAWDYGRASFIARCCANIGYLQDDEAWQCMKTAAENAAGIYSGWREYLAAYIFGRAIGYGDNSSDIRHILKYLLNDSKSPFNEVTFK